MPRDTALTVVVSADDADGLATRDLALSWHRDGLLGDFAWVTPGDLDRSGYGPPAITATMAGREDPVELMTCLGEKPRSLIRVVLLHLLTHELSEPDTLVYTCDEIADLVGRARPRTIDADGNHHGTRLLRINLMVPESDLQPQDPRIILPAWEVNAVVSPEDRPELDRQSVFVRRSANLHGHALNAAAAAGGLWSSIDQGAFDSHESDSTTGGGEVVVVRCQARILVGDDRNNDLARRVVSALEESPTGPAAFVSWAQSAPDPAALASDSAERLMQHPQWAPLEPETEPLPTRRLTLADLVRQWWTFQLRLVPAVLLLIVDRRGALAGRLSKPETVVHDAGDAPRVGPLWPEAMERLTGQRLASVERQLLPSRLEARASTWATPTPAAWRVLRQLAIGLVDGSRLPPGHEQLTRGGAIETLPPGFVVADPDDVYELDDGERMGPVDVERAEVLAAARDADERHTREQQDRPRGGRHADRSAQQRLSPELQDPGNGQADPLLRWLDRHRNTLLWQVTARAVEQKRAAGERAAAARTVLADTSMPPTKTLESAKNLLVGAWVVTLGALTLLAAVAVLNALEDPIAVLRSLPDVQWGDVVGTVVVVCLLLLAAGTTYFQASRSYDGQVTARLHALQRAGDAYVTACRQERRWSTMRDGLTDWAELLGELLHHPWTAPPPGAFAAPGYRGLPAAVAVAVPAGAAAPDWSAVSSALEHLCHKGWLMEEFGRIVGASPMNHTSPERSSSSGPLPPSLRSEDLPADLDLGRGSAGPRGELVTYAGRASVKRDAGQRMTDRLELLLSKGDVRLPPRVVTRVGAGEPGEHIVDREFLTPRDTVAPFVNELFTPTAQLAQYQVPERTVLCLPAEVEPPTSLPSVVHTEHHASLGSAMIRVDVSSLITHDDIALFERVRRPEHRPAPSPEDFN